MTPPVAGDDAGPSQQNGPSVWASRGPPSRNGRPVRVIPGSLTALPDVPHEARPPSPPWEAPPGLVTFLDARLQDDETAAQAAIATRDILPATAIEQSSDHRARHGPIRVLRDVAAKRAMVRMWLDGVSAQRAQPQVQGLDVADAMIMALVAVYADHTDFRPEWLATDRP